MRRSPRRWRRLFLLAALCGASLLPATAPHLPLPLPRHGYYQDAACLGPLCLIDNGFFELSWGEY